MRDGRELIITPPTPLLPSTGFVVEVLYAGEPGPAPRDPDGFLDGWNYTEYGAYTSTPPQGADTWYPNNNTTNDKAAFTFTVTVPADRQVMSNGILVSNTINEAAGTSTWVWDAPDPMATYLATLQIGKYTIQRYTTPRRPPDHQRHPAGPADRRRRRRGWTRSPRSWTSSARGSARTRSWPRGAIVDLVNAGYQMEQQTRPIFTSANGLSRARPRARPPVVGRQRRVAARPRRVVERGLRHVRRRGCGPSRRAASPRKQAFLNSYNRTGTFWNNTVFDPGVVNQYQSATVYQRGAQTLQALRQRIGDEKFFNTLSAYHSTFKGSVAETQDFVAIAQRESGEDLRDFFKQWLYTPGKPTEAVLLLHVRRRATSAARVPATLALTLGTPATFGRSRRAWRRSTRRPRRRRSSRPPPTRSCP